MRKMLLYIKLFFTLSLCIMVLQGCEKSAICDCFKGTGDEITVDRSVSPFHYVELRNKVNLYVHPSTEYRMTVTAGKNLIDKVTTEIENGILRIDNENKCNWVRDFDNTFDVHVYLPLLDTLEIFDCSGNVYFTDTMRADRFSMQSWSSTGDYYLKVNAATAYFALQTGPASLYAEGKAGVAYMWNQGQGLYDAKNFSVDDIYVANRSQNHMYMVAKKRLYARIEFSGNIYYQSDATDLQLEDYGGGEYVKINSW
jgi:hypothetical protein